jgi:DNA polymerase-3 subunit gamma/tau
MPKAYLDQMISFCGNAITEKDVLEVYGLASAEEISSLARALIDADYAEIVAAVERLAGDGRDLFRVLVDLQSLLRIVLLDAIAQGGATEKLGLKIEVEPLMRLMDSLHQSETAVQRGLSQKVNFEVALLRGVEAGRARAIDNLINELADLANQLPEAEKKKS